MVGGGGVGVAREDDGDGGASAEVDGGGDGGEDGGGDGGEVDLHVDDEEGGGFGVGVSLSDFVFCVGRG